jgi:hypothetical protein
MKRLAFAFFTLAVACGPRIEGLDRNTLPEPVRADYDLFARKCSKCHSLARPLSSGITDDDQWSMYVTRMRRQPASGITPDDQEIILRFLHYYSVEQKRIRAEKSASGAPAPSPPPPTTPSPASPAPIEGGQP